jgi:integrase/recombinase XerD
MIYRRSGSLEGGEASRDRQVSRCMPNKTTKRNAAVTSGGVTPDPDSLVRFADLLKLRSLAPSTQAEYLRYVRKLAARLRRDPAVLDEAQLRAHLLHLKDGKDGHGYSGSSMRTAVAAFSAFYNLHLGHDWKLFRLVRSPSPQTLPSVLTRTEVKRLFGVIREERFRTVLRLIYACGLRVSEAINLEVTQIKRDGPRLHLQKTKFSKERLVPLPQWAYRELQDYWKTHRHPRWIFPGVGRGWRETPGGVARLAHAAEPMGIGSIQHCVRIARADARLPESTHVHTLRHSYATHLLEAGVSIRLISAYLGHASLETTLVYTHLTAVNEASARDALEDMRPDEPAV